MSWTPEQRAILAEIDRLTQTLVRTVDPEYLTTAQVLVTGVERTDWVDGKEVVVPWHPGVRYSTVLGMLTSAAGDYQNWELIAKARGQ